MTGLLSGALANLAWYKPSPDLLIGFSSDAL
jgi:hypothetical protein